MKRQLTAPPSRAVCGRPRASATAAWVTLPSSVLTPRASAGSACDGAGQAPVGEGEQVGQRGVGERVGRRVRHRAGDVADRVVEDAVHLVDGVVVGGLVGRLDAAALVDGHVDDDRAGLHAAHHVLGDDHRRPAAGHEHRADDEVGLGDRPLDRAPVGGQRHDAALVDLVDPAEPVDVLVEQEHLGLHARRDPRRVPPDVARADHDHPAGPDAGRAAEQHAPAAVLALEVVRADLGGHAPGHLAHRGEQRQRAVRRAAPSRRRRRWCRRRAARRRPPGRRRGAGR